MLKFTKESERWSPAWLSEAGDSPSSEVAARHSMLFLAASSKLWIWGGYGAGGARDDLLAIDPASDTWSILTPCNPATSIEILKHQTSNLKSEL